MIKGVNRQIIEITDVSSDYYERALLIVKPEFSELNKKELEKEAKKVLGNVGVRYNKNHKMRDKLLKYGISLFLFISMLVLILGMFKYF